MWGWSTAGVALVIAVWALARAQRALRRTAAEAESRSATSSELLRVLIDASPLALVLCTDVGRIVLDNAAAQQLFFAGQSAAGQNFLRLVANGPEAWQRPLLHASDEIVGLGAEGRHETYHITRRTLQYAGARHSLLLVRSITREVAQHDIGVLKRVVRLISHEVNNSLAPVSSLVHSARVIMASGERPERLERVFDSIDERSRHLAEFIAGYASLARLPQPAPRPVEWSALLSRLGALYPEAQLHAPPAAEGYFDPGQLEQALINLLKNACESGGPRTEVQLCVTPLRERAAELQVLDRGRGFAAEALEHALLPFYTTKPGGSGVGLALVREVVHAHGGRLSLGARAGGGAAVRLELPGPRMAPDPDARARLTLTRT